MPITHTKANAMSFEMPTPCLSSAGFSCEICPCGHWKYFLHGEVMELKQDLGALGQILWPLHSECLPAAGACIWDDLILYPS